VADINFNSNSALTTPNTPMVNLGVQPDPNIVVLPPSPTLSDSSILSDSSDHTVRASYRSNDFSSTINPLESASKRREFNRYFKEPSLVDVSHNNF